MQIQAYVEILEKLSVLDAELRELSAALEGHRTSVEGRRSHLRVLEERFQRGQQSLAEMDRARAELMQEFRQMAGQVEKSREKLSRCRNEREANAAQREVEEIRKLHKDRESEIEKLGALAGQARADLETVSKERDTLTTELQALAGEVEGTLVTLDANLAQKTKEREILVKGLAAPIYRRYELVRKRRGSALAWTSAEAICSACHIRLQPMVIHKLKQADDLGQCPSCQRILYYRVDRVPDGADGVEPS